MIGVGVIFKPVKGTFSFNLRILEVMVDSGEINYSGDLLKFMLLLFS
jgi:hypothetical protein